jgi:hypothetical protein
VTIFQEKETAEVPGEAAREFAYELMFKAFMANFTDRPRFLLIHFFNNVSAEYELCRVLPSRL